MPTNGQLAALTVAGTVVVLAAWTFPALSCVEVVGAAPAAALVGANATAVAEPLFPHP
jgi:hypothetical protein